MVNRKKYRLKSTPVVGDDFSELIPTGSASATRRLRHKHNNFSSRGSYGVSELDNSSQIDTIHIVSDLSDKEDGEDDKDDHLQITREISLEDSTIQSDADDSGNEIIQVNDVSIQSVEMENGDKQDSDYSSGDSDAYGDEESLKSEAEYLPHRDNNTSKARRYYKQKQKTQKNPSRTIKLRNQKKSNLNRNARLKMRKTVKKPRIMPDSEDEDEDDFENSSDNDSQIDSNLSIDEKEEEEEDEKVNKLISKSHKVTVEQEKFNELSSAQKLERVQRLIALAKEYVENISSSLLEQAQNSASKNDIPIDKEEVVQSESDSDVEIIDEFNQPKKIHNKKQKIFSRRKPRKRNAKKDLLTLMTESKNRKSNSSKNKTNGKKTNKKQIQVSVSKITDQPKILTGAVLRDYQIDGMAWLIALYQQGLNGILADEMGLGKTIQTISLLAYLYGEGNKGPFLIACPLSTLGNWYNEFKNFTPTLPVLAYTGVKDIREQLRKKHFKALKSGKISVLITSYEVILNDRRYLNKFDWKYLVVDEGHRLKNTNCRLINELKKLKTENRLLLTGTPLQNNLNELWSLLNFILPNIFHDLELFQQWFDFSSFNSDNNENHTSQLIDSEIQKGLVSNLHSILKPFLLRRLKKLVTKSLPPKREYLIYSSLTPSQWDMYHATLNKELKTYLLKLAFTEHIECNNYFGNREVYSMDKIDSFFKKKFSLKPIDLSEDEKEEEEGTGVPKFGQRLQVDEIATNEKRKLRSRLRNPKKRRINYKESDFRYGDLSSDSEYIGDENQDSDEDLEDDIMINDSSKLINSNGYFEGFNSKDNQFKKFSLNSIENKNRAQKEYLKIIENEKTQIGNEVISQINDINQNGPFDELCNDLSIDDSIINPEQERELRYEDYSDVNYDSNDFNDTIFNKENLQQNQKEKMYTIDSMDTYLKPFSPLPDYNLFRRDRPQKPILYTPTNDLPYNSYQNLLENLKLLLVTLKRARENGLSGNNLNEWANVRNIDIIYQNLKYSSIYSYYLTAKYNAEKKQYCNYLKYLKFVEDQKILKLKRERERQREREMEKKGALERKERRNFASIKKVHETIKIPDEKNEQNEKIEKVPETIEILDEKDGKDGKDEKNRITNGIKKNNEDELKKKPTNFLEYFENKENKYNDEDRGMFDKFEMDKDTEDRFKKYYLKEKGKYNECMKMSDLGGESIEKEEEYKKFKLLYFDKVVDEEKDVDIEIEEISINEQNENENEIEEELKGNKTEIEEELPKFEDIWQQINNDIDNKKLNNVVMQLRLICDSPYLFYFPWDNDESIDVNRLIDRSSKMQILNQLVSKLIERKHRVLIFSQFVKMLDLIEDWCDIKKYRCCRIDGQMTQTDRQEEIDKFGDIEQDYSIFLLSTRAGGLGINLTAADSVILFDSDWNPQVDLQAMDRVHRIGQTKPVIIYRFATIQTIEQVLLMKADSKRQLERLVIQMGKFESLRQLADERNKAGPKNKSKTNVLINDLKAFVTANEFKGYGDFNDNILEEEEMAVLLDRRPEAYIKDETRRFKHVELFETSAQSVLETEPVDIEAQIETVEEVVEEAAEPSKESVAVAAPV
ncbi:DEAD/DEAH box helicase ASCRUDRAFT_77545 [Ascoidea rubescens DSM 1968]|uniref:Uncharacterized protein n=1 Tax=Ascoidea rubescens DSM 1968 TaxID=1344418 RepID=A0A1D2VBF5_9ASCO|nr:hypothetical protein ASCRUDRAFT_77545 [Ascoidea rubescens DSM 1968]ODV58803.1 hypothetical protein ASCRUDRAFT_77545 [Ascoidea rubescens DSM 1968]